MKDVISVDTINELMDEAVTQGMIAMQLSMGDGLPGRHDKVIEKTKAKLHSLLISKLPEKQWNDVLKLKKMSPWERMKARAFVKGRASAIDDMRKSIDEMFEVKNATS